MEPITYTNNLNQDIEKIKQEHPEIVKALDLFDIGMKEYVKAFRHLSEPQIMVTNNTNDLLLQD